MHPTTESSSAVCITPWSQARRCASYRRVKGINFHKKLRGVHHTAESSSAVCIIPRSQAPRCASHRGVKLRGVHHTAESSDEEFSKSSAVCITPRSQTPRCASYHEIDTVSRKLFKESFLLQTFFDKTKSKVVTSTKTRKTDIFESV